MESIIVTPLKGFNGVHFGMLRNEVRKILGNPYREFKKTKFSKNMTDDYVTYHIYYNAEDQFEAVEFFDNVTVCDDKGIVFPRKTVDYAALPYHFENEEESLICFESEIGVCAPNGTVASICFGMKGYY